MNFYDLSYHLTKKIAIEHCFFPGEKCCVLIELDYRILLITKPDKNSYNIFLFFKTFKEKFAAFSDFSDLQNNFFLLMHQTSSFDRLKTTVKLFILTFFEFSFKNLFGTNASIKMNF